MSFYLTLIIILGYTLYCFSIRIPSYYLLASREVSARITLFTTRCLQDYDLITLMRSAIMYNFQGFSKDIHLAPTIIPTKRPMTQPRYGTIPSPRTLYQLTYMKALERYGGRREPPAHTEDPVPK